MLTTCWNEEQTKTDDSDLEDVLGMNIEYAIASLCICHRYDKLRDKRITWRETGEISQSLFLNIFIVMD